jgi:sporulation protein YlmC with PRC-barrel domain
MTEVSMGEAEIEEPLILEKLSDLEEQEDYLAHFPDIRGQAVINPIGDEVGIVEDVYVNPRNRQVEMASIRFTAMVGTGGKHVLIPVEELEILDNRVRILTHEDKVRLAPEFHEGAPSYEPYYEYWGSQAIGPSEEPASAYVRPPGRLVLEGEEEEE